MVSSCSLVSSDPGTLSTEQCHLRKEGPSRTSLWCLPPTRTHVSLIELCADLPETACVPLPPAHVLDLLLVPHLQIKYQPQGLAGAGGAPFASWILQSS